MPVTTTVYRWLLKHEQFRQSYVGARKLQADHLAEEILEIADNAANGDGNRDALNIAKLRIDARKWLAGQLRPKKYGDENDFEQSADSTDTAPALNVIIESNSKT